MAPPGLDGLGLAAVVDHVDEVDAAALLPLGAWAGQSSVSNFPLSVLLITFLYHTRIKALSY